MALPLTLATICFVVDAQPLIYIQNNFKTRDFDFSSLGKVVDPIRAQNDTYIICTAGRV